MIKCLVFGGAGFIGAHVAQRLLKRGDHVTVADNRTDAFTDRFFTRLKAKASLDVIDVDLRLSESHARFGDDYDYIFDFAALLGVERVLAHPWETLVDNTALAQTAMEVARAQRNLKSVFFAGTSEIYSGALLHGAVSPLAETVPLTLPDLSHPRTSYMLSKAVGESLCHYSGAPAVIGRFFNIYGPRMGMSHAIPQLMERAWKLSDGEDFAVYSADHRRAFCYIDDAVDIILALAGSPDAIGGTYNIGNGDTDVRIDELAGIILKTVDRPQSKIVPAGDHQGSSAHRAPDMNLTKTMTGLTAATSLERGCKQTFDWYLENVFTA